MLSCPAMPPDTHVPHLHLSSHRHAASYPQTAKIWLRGGCISVVVWRTSEWSTACRLQSDFSRASYASSYLSTPSTIFFASTSEIFVRPARTPFPFKSRSPLFTSYFVYNSLSILLFFSHSSASCRASYASSYLCKRYYHESAKPWYDEQSVTFYFAFPKPYQEF